MIPTSFPEKNKTLQRPIGTTEEECSPLDIYADGTTCLSCWKASWRERLAVLFFGRVWIWVWTGTTTQPPVSLLGAKTAFIQTNTIRGRIKAAIKKVMEVPS